MPAKFAILSSIALACAAAVQGASIVDGGNATLVARACDYHDTTPAHCQTSGGSPMASDCAEAIKRLATRCVQGNDAYIYGEGSDCKTQVRYGTCKIDVCGQFRSRIADGVVCGGYLQTILNDCQSNGLVGGWLRPADCNVHYYYKQGPETYYRLQFSKHK